jgi:hypothetical protein
VLDFNGWVSDSHGNLLLNKFFSFLSLLCLASRVSRHSIAMNTIAFLDVNAMCASPPLTSISGWDHVEALQIPRKNRAIKEFLTVLLCLRIRNEVLQLSNLIAGWPSQRGRYRLLNCLKSLIRSGDLS